MQLGWLWSGLIGWAGFYGLPTKVVTLWAPSENVKREPLTVTLDCEARLALAEVTHGVIEQGAAPEMKTERFAALVLMLMATTTMVPSAWFVYAERSTPDGTVPEVETRM